MIERFMSEVQEERKKQDRRWGKAHDDTHSPLEWFGIICYEASEIALISSLTLKQRALVKVAAVALAAYEAIERKKS